MNSYDRSAERGNEHSGMESLRTSIAKTVGTVQRRIDEFREHGIEKVTEDVVDYLRAQPLNALLIAAGLGMLLGILSGIRRR